MGGTGSAFIGVIPELPVVGSTLGRTWPPLPVGSVGGRWGAAGPTGTTWGATIAVAPACRGGLDEPTAVGSEIVDEDVSVALPPGMGSVTLGAGITTGAGAGAGIGAWGAIIGVSP